MRTSSTASRLAPLLMSVRTDSSCPRRLAYIRAVMPFCVYICYTHISRGGRRSGRCVLAAVCEASSTAQLPDSNPTSVPQPVWPNVADLLSAWLNWLEILPPDILYTHDVLTNFVPADMLQSIHGAGYIYMSTSSIHTRTHLPRGPCEYSQVITVERSIWEHIYTSIRTLL